MRTLFLALVVCLLAIAVNTAQRDQDLNQPLYKIFAGLALRQYELSNPSAQKNLIVIEIYSVRVMFPMAPIYQLKFLALPKPQWVGARWICNATVIDNFLQNTTIVHDVNCEVQILA